MFHLIPHTHWDREWYLPHSVFQARLVPVLDDILARLTRDPTYRSFLLDGQTVLIEDYLQVRPERANEIRALGREGRLSLGPWYVLADELIPSGEALVRNLLAGAADVARYADGHRLDVLYSPDAFGHPAAWPLLAREFGIKYGVLWRGLAGPGDLYRWGDVLVWHLPPSGYEIGAGLPADRTRLRDAWEAVREQLVPRAVGSNVAVFVGADHHAAHPDVGALRELLAELDPGNGFRVSRLEEFFQAQEGAWSRAPALRGELRASARAGGTWGLQGVHGTRAPEKRANSVLELWLERFAEPLAALARRSGNARDRQPLLDFTWRALVRCQFHDTLAGTVSDTVADAVRARHQEIEALAREIVRGAIHDLVGHDPDAARERVRGGDASPALVVWNPAARPRGGVVVADVTFFRRDILVGPPSGRVPREQDGYRPFALTAANGAAFPVQVLSRADTLERIEATRHYPDQDAVTQVRVAFSLSPAPVRGLGCHVLRLRGPMSGLLPSGDAVRVGARTLVNDRVSVELDDRGTLTLRPPDTGERYPGLLALDSEPDSGDAYTFSPGTRSRRRRGTPAVAVRKVAAGPLVGALEARFTIPAGMALKGAGSGEVGIRLLVTLHAGSPLVHCVLDIDNRGIYHRLRARLPAGITGVPITAGGPFGTITRAASETIPPATDHGLFEAPVRTAPAHRFVAASSGSRGLALLAPGFFEYEWSQTGDLFFTLLRAIGQLSRSDLPTRPGHAAWPTEIPGAQCLGPTRVELALAAVTSAEIERGDVLPTLWEDAFVPLRGYWLRDAGDLSTETPDIMLEGPGLVLSAVKPAQAGSPMVLRCYNATGNKVAGAWRFGVGIRSAHRVRADERESSPLVLEGRGHVVRFAALPHEIVSLLVT